MGALVVFVCALVLDLVVEASSDAGLMLVSSVAVATWLVMAYMFSIVASRRWIAEINLRARTLRISRLLFGRWTKTIVHCSLDQCRSLGITEHETECIVLYGVYVELTDGTRHTIPLKNSTLQEAGHVASQISDLTGISIGQTRSRPPTHEIDLDPWSTERRSESRQRCSIVSFCAESQHEVRKLIAGPSGSLCICNECVVMRKSFIELQVVV
jgi:hypothetical protein